MSRITKQDANIIAKKLAEKKKKVADDLQNEYCLFVTNAYLKTVPKEVLVLFKEQGHYFKKTSTISFSGHGFRWESISVPNRELIPTTDGAATLLLNEKLAGQIMKLKGKCDKASKEYNELVREIENALLALVTYARIEKDFPEAAPLLPKKQTMALAINFTDIRKKIA